MNSNTKAFAGIWSFIGSYILVIVIAAHFGGFDIAWPELKAFASGGLQEVTKNRTTFLMMFPVILAVVAIDLPCSVGAAIVQALLLGKSGKHGVSEMVGKLKEGNIFAMFFLLVLAEELFARWFFLGLLTKIPFLSGITAFYVLFFLGNGIWALVHLRNFKDPKDRHWLRVLPQFVSGFFFTYVYVKYGLLAAVLTHYAANAILFSLHKVQNTNGVDGLITGYSALCALVSYWLMNKPLTDMLPWFANEPHFSLEGWSFWDYVKANIFVTAGFTAAFGLLLYDRSHVGKKEKRKKSDENQVGPVGYILGAAIIVGILYGLYWIFGFVTSSVPYRIVFLAIFLAFTHKGASGSAASRTFWTALPSTYVTICVLQAVGYWLAIAFVAVNLVVQSPLAALRQDDD